MGRQGQIYAMRTVPSAGGRHPFETYLLANRITGLDPGLYRYLPVDHKLCALEAEPDLVSSGLALFWRLSSTSRCHPVGEQIGWLESAGFGEITPRPTPMPSQVLLTGRAP